MIDMHKYLDEIWWIQSESGRSESSLSTLDNLISMYWNPGNSDGKLDYLLLTEILTYR